MPGLDAAGMLPVLAFEPPAEPEAEPVPAPLQAAKARDPLWYRDFRPGLIMRIMRSIGRAGPCRARVGAHRLFEQPLEEQPALARSAAVEAERELVEVVVEQRFHASVRTSLPRGCSPARSP